LSTDYFNSFNEIVMLLGMVGDMPEVLEDIRAWTFRSYEEHFFHSGLSFGPLAIEAYAHAPADVRQRFDSLIRDLRQAIEDARMHLKPAGDEPARARLKLDAARYSSHLQGLIETGSGIVHGADMKIGQTEVDKMF
jgi:hypothetical protein